jgi:arylsulfatase
MISSGALAASFSNNAMSAEPGRRQVNRSAERLSKRPNILWICTDQQRYDTIGALGNKYIRTPNLDKLIETGTAFTHAYCQNPICTPSRASFLTGYYPRSIRACTNGNEKWENAAPLITKTLADIGYDCALAGKFHLSAAHNRIEPRVDDGYRVFDWSHHPPDEWTEGANAYIEWLKSKGYHYGKLKQEQGAIPTALHQTTWCANRAIDFMKEKRSGPWLFSFNCFDPHPPLDPPKEYLDRFDIDSMPMPPFKASDIEEYDRLRNSFFQSECKKPEAREAKLNIAKYWAMIELIDHNVGRMLKALEETGQRDNTLVIFTSDHGNMIGHHGLMHKGCRFYEGLVRVPLIMSLPGTFKQNMKNDALVELVDIAPTLLELSGLPVDRSMHGKSLMGQLSGHVAPWEHRDRVYATYTNTLTSSEEDRPSYGTMVRTRRYKLASYHGTGKGQLFDLEKDPGEFVNLWDDPKHQTAKTELLQRSYDITVMTTSKGSRTVGRY